MDQYRLDKILEAVEDEESFVNFLSELHKEWLQVLENEEKYPSAKYGGLSYGWENGDLESFLEAASAGGKDHLETKSGNFNNTPWQRAAFIIYLGKCYE